MVVVHDFQNGSVTLELTERMEHPFYWWPETLVSYQVRFHEPVTAAGIELVQGEEEIPTPFQLSAIETDADGGLQAAEVYFLTDLPSGGRREFTLRASPTPTQPDPDEAVTIERSRDHLVVDTGALRARLPTAATGEDAAIPGPITGLDRGTGWLGDASFFCPDRSLDSLTTEVLEAGPLFATHRLAYRFDDGAEYTAKIRSVAGREFLSFDETMTGFDHDGAAKLEMDWSDLEATHREAPNHPHGSRPYENALTEEPGFGRYDWQTIDASHFEMHYAGTTEAIDDRGELVFGLGPQHSQDQYTGGLAYGAFWNEDTGDTIGAFVNRVGDWDDGVYARWPSSSDRLDVRYVYDEGDFVWEWPLGTGSRSTCLTCYDHQKDIEAMERMESLHQQRDVGFDDGFEYHVSLGPISHTLFLHNRYSVLDLDRVKDWELEYPQDAHTQPDIFTEGSIESPDELERSLREHELVTDLPTIGTRQNTGCNPVVSRVWHRQWIDAYDRLASDLDGEQYERVTATYLFMAHLYASDEGLITLRPTLGNRPNFVSDVKAMVGAMAALFPEHPRAGEWADQFEATVQLLGRYYIRPPVETWRTHGGRWTENLSCYLWASFVPLIRISILLQEHYDGRTPLADPNVTRLGDWVVNALTAPFDGEVPGETERLLENHEGHGHVWGIVEPEDAPRRVLPPQGAHATRGTPPREAWVLGHLLQQYRPAVAESLMWAARPHDDGNEFRTESESNPWDRVYERCADEHGGDNRGTDPVLETRTYTGYGTVLRSGVGDPDEVSVHLQQLDDGPNYRWGNAGDGGCGAIYYAAAGEIYSHHDKEDVGDRFAHDTDFCCNCGVWTGETFESIGRNVLDGPRYDLDSVGYATLRPAETKDSPWPAYQRRTAMLVGTDYLLTHDEVFGDSTYHRFSWFTHREDQLPAIHMIEGGDAQPPSRGATRTELETPVTKGRWYDGHGDCQAVITHRELEVGSMGNGCRVEAEEFEDRVFRAQDPIEHAADGRRFIGRAGLIREHDTGGTTLAMLEGRAIAAAGLTLELEAECDLAVEATVDGPGAAVVAGRSDGREDGDLTVRLEESLPSDVAVYVDGERQSADRTDSELTVPLPAGEHRWTVSPEPPEPPAPSIAGVEVGSGAATVEIAGSPIADRYRVEQRTDEDGTWDAVASTTHSKVTLDGLEDGVKLHIRAVAINERGESSPSRPVPVYPTAEPPAPPAGLRLERADGQVALEWGTVPGARSYVLYRREAGDDTWERLTETGGNRYVDGAVAAPERLVPGADAAERPRSERGVSEYAVAARNGNGESERSRVVDTDPRSWLNWDPVPGERFRRFSGPVYYPE